MCLRVRGCIISVWKVWMMVEESRSTKSTDWEWPIRYIDRAGMGSRLWTSLASCPTSEISVDCHWFSCCLTRWMQFLRETVRIDSGGVSCCGLPEVNVVSKVEEQKS